MYTSFRAQKHKYPHNYIVSDKLILIQSHKDENALGVDVTKFREHFLLAAWTLWCRRSLKSSGGHQNINILAIKTGFRQISLLVYRHSQRRRHSASTLRCGLFPPNWYDVAEGAMRHSLLKTNKRMVINLFWQQMRRCFWIFSNEWLVWLKKILFCPSIIFKRQFITSRRGGKKRTELSKHDKRVREFESLPAVDPNGPEARAHRRHTTAAICVGWTYR